MQVKCMSTCNSVNRLRKDPSISETGFLMPCDFENCCYSHGVTCLKLTVWARPALLCVSEYPLHSDRPLDTVPRKSVVPHGVLYH